jgi:cytochrome c biogenesis protein CcmG, thiol:disulfide interchange protein DsbE
MKKLSLLIVLFSFVLTSFTADKKFPAIRIKSLDGKVVDLQNSFSKNKLTVISYWATWCGPCKKELDAIHDLYPTWKKMGVELVAVTIDDAQQLNKVNGIVAQKGWNYSILSDINKESLQKLNFQNIPQTFVVDKSGNILYSHSGYTPGDEYELEKKLRELLK